MEASRTPVARALGAVRSAGTLPMVVLALGALGGVLIIVAELSTIVHVDVLTTGTCEEIADPNVRDACESSGFEQHGGAFLLLGAVALAMAWGAARGASRPAAIALVAIGVVVLAFALARDIPDSTETGLVGLQFDEAEAKAGTGLYLEVIGAGLVMLAGIARLRRPGPSSRPDS